MLVLHVFRPSLPGAMHQFARVRMRAVMSFESHRSNLTKPMFKKPSALLLFFCLKAIVRGLVVAKKVGLLRSLPHTFVQTKSFLG